MSTYTQSRIYTGWEATVGWALPYIYGMGSLRVKQLLSILCEAQKVKETDLEFHNLYERFAENPMAVSPVAAPQGSGDDMGFGLYT